MSSERLAPGCIKTSADAQPRPLTDAEARQVFAVLAAKEDEIAFAYLYEGCECRAQLMIECMEPMGIDPGRAWIVSLGRKLSAPDLLNPGRKITWENHVAPTVAVEGPPHGVLVIDPSLSKTGPMTLSEWAAAARARVIEISELPLTQAQLLELQTAGVLRGGEPLDAVVFSLQRGQTPLPDVGGSGFRIGPDPPEGVSAFAHGRMQEFLLRQRQMGTGGH
jgi:Glutaminase